MSFLRFSNKLKHTNLSIFHRPIVINSKCAHRRITKLFRTLEYCRQPNSYAAIRQLRFSILADILDLPQHSVEKKRHRPLQFWPSVFGSYRSAKLELSYLFQFFFFQTSVKIPKHAAKQLLLQRYIEPHQSLANILAVTPNTKELNQCLMVHLRRPVNDQVNVIPMNSSSRTSLTRSYRTKSMERTTKYKRRCHQIRWSANVEN